MDQEEFKNRLSQVAIWSHNKDNQVVVDGIRSQTHPCTWCHMKESHGRTSISAVIDGNTRQRVWRIYCNTCSRHLDSETFQPVNIIRDIPIGRRRNTPNEFKPPKRPRGRPRKYSNP